MTATIVKLKTKNKKVGKEERKQIFMEVIDRLMEYELADVARASGVSYTTLHNWCYGSTNSPLLRTVYDVAEAIDLQFELVDTSSVQNTVRSISSRKVA